MFQQNLVLRWALAIILFMHSIPGMFNGGINDFGNLYLNQIGFDPFGVYLAWAIKLSHVAAAILFIANKYIKWAAWPTSVSYTHLDVYKRQLLWSVNQVLFLLFYL